MLSHDKILAVTLFVDENIASTIHLSDLAELLGLSVFHFARAFKEATGMSPMRYVLERRVLAAKIGLVSSKPLAEVALDAGFSSQSHFTTAFRRIIGLTPFEWRAGH